MSFVDEASSAIRESGGRFTSQRKRIVEILGSTDERVDAEQLYQLVHEQDRTISIATVYRTLKTLEEAGLIRERYLSPDHERKVYEPTSQPEHYHFMCRRCRRVIEFESRSIDRLKSALEVGLGVRVDHACICFEGLCHACQIHKEQA